MVFKKKAASGAGKAKVKRGTPEDDAQREIVKLLRDLEKFGLLLFFAVPNQLLRKKALKLIFWALGVRAGIPDLVILLPQARVLFVELKAKDGRLSDDQKALQAALVKFGFTVVTVHCDSPMQGRHAVADFLRTQGVRC